MTIASDLLQRHFETFVQDNALWQTLIADDLVWELLFGEGQVTMDLGRRPLQLHVRCFQVWDHERRAA